MEKFLKRGTVELMIWSLFFLIFVNELISVRMKTYSLQRKFCSVVSVVPNILLMLNICHLSKNWVLILSFVLRRTGLTHRALLPQFLDDSSSQTSQFRQTDFDALSSNCLLEMQFSYTCQ